MRETLVQTPRGADHGSEKPYGHQHGIPGWQYRTRQEATLGVDVPLMEFMAIQVTVGDIGRKVAEGVLKRHGKA